MQVGDAQLGQVIQVLADPGQREGMAKAARSLARRDAADRIADLVESKARVGRRAA